MERYPGWGSTRPHARSMQLDSVWPNAANPQHYLEYHYGQPPVARPGWDLFGYRRNTWIDGEEHAWDRFGFRMYAALAWTYTMVVLEQNPVRHRFAEVTNVLVISMYRQGRSHYVVCEVANEVTAMDVYGVRILATVRVLRHWASRWRRGLRVLRRRRARMVLALTLPQAPEIITHVLMFL